MIEIKSLYKDYNKRSILEDVNISISNPGIYVLVGESGSGKTSLLNIIGLMEEEFEGNYHFFLKNVSKLTKKEKELIRYNQISYVYQTPKFLENESILSNVEVALNKKMDIKLLKRKLNEFNLTTKYKKKVSTLSGGERKRLSILISLLKETPLLLCDEIMVGLDRVNKELVIRKLLIESKTRVIILVTHDQSFIKEYSKNIYELKDKKIKEIKSIGRVFENEERNDNKLKNKFINKHVFTHIKEKSGRTLICSLCNVVALVSLGFSILLTSSLSNAISESLNNNINDNQIIVSNKFESNMNNKNEVIDKEEMKLIKKEFNPYFTFEGVRYFNDFSSFFKDEEYALLEVDNVDIPLRGYDINCINEFAYFNEGEETFIYTNSYDLEEDQVIISLSPNQVYTYTKNLGLDYINEGSLLPYFEDNYFNLTFYLTNEDWGYQTSFSLQVIGYYVSSTPRIYHTNSLWNEYIIEEVLQLTHSYELDVIDEIPWTTKKVHYFQIKENEEMNFLNGYLSNKNFDNFQYSIFKNGDRFNVYFLKRHDKEFTKSTLDSFLDEDINSYIACSTLGYNVIGSALLQGFSYPTFISNEYNLLEQYIDYNTYSSENLGAYQSTILESVSGNLLSLNLLDLSLDNIVKMKSYTNENINIKGKYPEKYNEILISKGLLKKLNLDENTLVFSGKPLYLLTLKDTEYANGKYKNNFIIEKIYVTGIVDESDVCIYVSSYWATIFLTISLERSYRDYLTSSAILEYQGDDIKNYIETMNNLYPSYIFENPFLDYKQKVDETIYYVNLGLIVFSSFCLIASLLMVIISSYLFVVDTKKEIGIYTFYGYERKSIEKQYRTFGKILSNYASFVSCICLLVIMELLNTGVLGIIVPFTLNSISPFIVMIAVSQLIGNISSYLSCYKTLRESPLEQLQEN